MLAPLALEAERDRSEDRVVCCGTRAPSSSGLTCRWGDVEVPARAEKGGEVSCCVPPAELLKADPEATGVPIKVMHHNSVIMEDTLSMETVQLLRSRKPKALQDGFVAAPGGGAEPAVLSAADVVANADSAAEAPEQQQQPGREGEVKAETRREAMQRQYSALRPFVIISLSYLLFTTTDGAVRMIVLLHAYTSGFSAWQVAIAVPDVSSRPPHAHTDRPRLSPRLDLRFPPPPCRTPTAPAHASYFLFGSRDMWFEVPLPFFLRNVAYGLGWSRPLTGLFLAVWIIVYGQVQSWTPQLVLSPLKQAPANKYVAVLWNALLVVTPLFMGCMLQFSDIFTGHHIGGMTAVMVGGLGAFCLVFAVNSSIHSYLIVRYAEGDKVAMNVGFYYCANAMGRLTGTLVSGALYSYAGDTVVQGFAACFWASLGFAVLSAAIEVLLRDDSGGLLCGRCLTLVKPPPGAADGPVVQIELD
ncbi:hypothetical protein TSOC_002123 [Tetrabaena socialis]|uniref:Uncharacterized protein n=1 Tax=Tetrabaena socialis TaxID=47790 RepID=A0A2J8AEV6_9CHLO|nr:hypothetical protein TSOC_002123 [Tetrabaena socialis]|eukprot:PNH11053.1 hypothetical protein TSOC_002123 [Tetrabaena socialis]